MFCVPRVRPEPLFVPIDRIGGLDPVDNAQVAQVAQPPPLPSYGGYAVRAAVPLHQVLRQSPLFPSHVEVGFEPFDSTLDRLGSLAGAPPREEILRRIRFNHLGIDLGALRLGTQLDLGIPVPRAPTRRELVMSPIVRGAIEQAWTDSCADDASLRHEEGGWIHLNVVTGDLFVRRAVRGSNAEIDLSKPILYVDSVIVGTFHTHPHPPDSTYEPGPSISDEDMDLSRGVPGIVRSWLGYHAYGCEQRESLRGRTGFFPGTPDDPLD